ncbi:MAG: 3-deoxy-D-manno-octulosonic acid transferase [Crocinitomicaceae bacterium]|nr:3-deoxy-D-manno-octulosonic acid transferase [Crocinitomicaceae bacterium]
MKFFYTLGVNFYTLGVRIASLWNPKARKWVDGRRDVWKKLEQFQPKKNIYWFHCASLGEFEQGRPIIEEIKSRQNCQIVITFFSPSGYEVRKGYREADLVVYLPKDSASNARRFIDVVQPDHVFFIKYEFWAHYIFECRARNIPVYSVSALFRRDQVFFTGYGGFMRKVLKEFTKIFVQNESSKALLNEIEIEAIVSGDTRYDRVMKNAEKVVQYEAIETFCRGGKVMICGSIWQEDLEVIKDKIGELEDWKVIIAPHEISPRFIEKIKRSINLKSICYSQIDSFSDERLLIIDNIGMLMNLYQYGQIAFIGGAFRTGLHNILEPAAFGLPVIFGNKYSKFPEAYEFIENGIGFSVANKSQFSAVLDELMKSDLKEKVNRFMHSHTGATEIVLNELSISES